MPCKFFENCCPLYLSYSVLWTLSHVSNKKCTVQENIKYPNTATIIIHVPLHAGKRGSGTEWHKTNVGLFELEQKHWSSSPAVFMNFVSCWNFLTEYIKQFILHLFDEKNYLQVTDVSSMLKNKQTSTQIHAKRLNCD